MAYQQQSRFGRFTIIVNRECDFTIDGLRRLACDPAMRADAVALAQKFYPQSSLGRAA